MQQYKLFFLLLTVLLSLASTSFSQNPDLKRTNHWYFGDFAGLDFTSGSPVADTNGAISTLERTAAISDTNGVLQCYFGFGYQTNYQWCVYNREHHPMPNGCNIGPDGYSTPRDCGVFVPKPGDDSTYYLFTVDGWENQYQRGLRWHEIDMRQDSGRGDVVSHDNVLFAPVSEQLAACRHGNGCDYWVVSHERSSASFLAYQVTASGIDTIPVISSVGTDYSVPQQLHNYNGGGSIKFSPDGTIAAAIVYWSWLVTGIPEDLELFQFDNNTGLFSNCINLPTDTSVLGPGFSPDSKKLYYYDGNYLSKMYQYDLTIYDSSLIIGSKTFVFSNGTNISIAEDYLLGVDGKLYMCVEFYNGQPNPPYLSTIDNPNNAGSVIVSPMSVSTGGRGTSQGLPNFVSSFTNPTAPPPCTTGISETVSGNTPPFFPNPAAGYLNIMNPAWVKRVRIYGITGNLLLDKPVATTASATISLENFSNGIYILQISDNKQYLQSFKLIINH